ncbi:hypothetical protein GGD68_004274 [Paraburkholderia fungorum]|jgi:hypothetical protein|uniref:Uncharacterized protein n=1 Tax=Paraburkholderia fungorum TaxID=134537 RepID=A0AAW3UZ71_9BURK|nr:hypothetical protein [Paraburkholderia fungorum]MBB6203433.1 hypothetical protein [Paraburkholderia fungorum]
MEIRVGDVPLSNPPHTLPQRDTAHNAHRCPAMSGRFQG